MPYTKMNPLFVKIQIMFQTFKVKVWGENACFTRPEMKVERVSYDVITPSSARAIFESILWKPAIKWVITQIDILNPIKYESIRRNEVSSRMSPSSTILIEENRQQRAGLILKDVAYIIHGHFEMTSKAGQEDNPIKFTEQFLKRLQKGQCHYQPYLGCREFTAYFSVPDEIKDKLINENRDLGWMLYDIDFENNMQAKFFRAEIKNGSIITDPKVCGVLS